MEYQELKNFGELYTGKASPRVIMKALAAVPAELGFIGTPKFLTQFQGKDRYWKKKRFKALEERQVGNREVVEGMQINLAFFTAVVAACGEEKGPMAFSKLAEKMGVLIYEEFMPSAVDFTNCPDPWEAARHYFREFFRVQGEAGIARFEVTRDTDSEFHIQFSDCAWYAVACEAGYPGLMAITAQPDVVFLPRLMRGIGGDFKRECWLCRGEGVCDWHFYRHRIPD